MTELLSSVNIELAVFGGVLIGLSATLLLYFFGRIAGICGMAFSLLDPSVLDKHWRIVFLVGLIAGTWLVHVLFNIAIPPPPSDNLFLLIVAGLLTGFGSKLGNGCTSGHGVCGISRLSLRSIVATMTFMASGFLSVFLLFHIIGGA